jgi:tRNA threonylcarbamoyladenosine biosynthesis protein TsaB
VPTLEALAAQAVRMNAARDGDRVAPMIDARRNEVYTALYEVRDGGVCHPLTGAEAVDVASLAARMAGGRRTVLCGDGAAKFLEAAAEPSRYTMTACGCSAAAVALLGERLLAGGGGAADLASLEPLYVKEFSSTAHL